MLVSTFIPSLHGGGAERVVVNLVEELARRGIPQRLVMLEPHIRGNLGMQYEVPEGVEVHTLRSTLRSCVPELTGYLRRNPPDVLISHITRSNIAARTAHALAGRPCKVVLVEHNTPSQEFGNERLEHRVIRRLVRLVHPGADAVVTVSRTAAADLEEFAGLRRGSAITLFNPLIPRDLGVRAADAPDHPWFDGQRPVIVGLGRLQPEKNWQLLLRAFAIVREKRPEVRLVILGSGPEERTVNAEAVRLGVESAVDLHGFAANPYAYMRAASAVALTSRYEGLPSVVVEAIACGTQVVATRSGGGVAEAMDGGRFGTLTPLDDDNAVAAALLRACDRPASAEATVWAYGRFGVGPAADRYEALLRGLAT